MKSVTNALLSSTFFFSFSFIIIIPVSSIVETDIRHSHVVKVTEMVIRRARMQLTKVFSLARKAAENGKMATKSQFGMCYLERKQSERCVRVISFK